VALLYFGCCRRSRTASVEDALTHITFNSKPRGELAVLDRVDLLDGMKNFPEEAQATNSVKLKVF
jgi:hypothetical protein